MTTDRSSWVAGARIAGAIAAAMLLGLSLFDGVLHPALRAAPWRSAAGLATGAVLALAPRLARLRQAFEGALFRSPDREFRFALFVAAASLYALNAWAVFGGVPYLDDDVAALFQGRLFARGQLTMPVPPEGDFFWLFGLLDIRHNLGHVCAMYPPGHPALLAGGVLLGAPWVVNPLLGAGLCLTVAGVGRQLYGRRIGRLAGLLALISPLAGILAGTHLSHIPTAFFCTLSLWSVCRLLRTRRWGFGLLAGAALGAAFLCRPLTSLILGMVLAAGPLWYWRRTLRCRRGVAAALFAVVVAAGLLLAFQKATTGDWRTPGHKIGMGRRNKFGFGVIDRARTHTYALGARYTSMRLGAINENLLGWPLPGLAVVLLPFFLRAARKEDFWLLAPLPALAAAYAPFWYYEFCLPARYVFCSTPMLLVLAARGIALLPGAGGRATAGAALRRKAAAAALAGFTVFGLVVGYRALAKRFRTDFGDVERVLPRVMRDYGIAHAVVFIDATGHSVGARPKGIGDTQNDFYATGFLRNDLDLRGGVIYARNLGGQNHRLAARYPGRRYYLYRYDRGAQRAYLSEIVFHGERQEARPIAPHTKDLLPIPAARPADGSG